MCSRRADRKFIARAHCPSSCSACSADDRLDGPSSPGPRCAPTSPSKRNPGPRRCRRVAGLMQASLQCGCGPCSGIATGELVSFYSPSALVRCVERVTSPIGPPAEHRRSMERSPASIPIPHPASPRCKTLYISHRKTGRHDGFTPATGMATDPSAVRGNTAQWKDNSIRNGRGRHAGRFHPLALRRGTQYEGNDPTN